MHRLDKEKGSGMHRYDRQRLECCWLPKRLSATTGYKPTVAMPGRKVKEQGEPREK